MLDAEALRTRLAGVSTVTARVATFVGADGQYAVVDLGGQRISVQFACAYVPEVNEPVWVDGVDGMLRLTGPTQPKPGLGVVVSLPDVDHVLVDTAFGPVTMPFHDGDELDTGDIVGILWSSGPKCFKMSTSPEYVDPPSLPSGGGADVKTVEFRAIDAGSTDRGAARWWNAQPWASNTTFGAWFYGGQIKDTVPASAEFVSLEFYVSRVQDQGGAPRFTLHSDPVKAGVPAMSAYVEWDPPNGWQTPPNAQEWFDALKAGGPRYGVGTNQGGYSKFSSLAQDGLSGALRVKWR
jgi:hypothetical protein